MANRWRSFAAPECSAIEPGQGPQQNEPDSCRLFSVQSSAESKISSGSDELIRTFDSFMHQHRRQQQQQQKDKEGDDGDDNQNASQEDKAMPGDAVLAEVNQKDGLAGMADNSESGNLSHPGPSSLVVLDSQETSDQTLDSLDLELRPLDIDALISPRSNSSVQREDAEPSTGPGLAERACAEQPAAGISSSAPSAVKCTPRVTFSQDIGFDSTPWASSLPLSLRRPADREHPPSILKRTRPRPLDFEDVMRKKQRTDSPNQLDTPSGPTRNRLDLASYPSSQSVGYLSMNLSNDLEPESEIGDVSVLAQSQKAYFLENASVLTQFTKPSELTELDQCRLAGAVAITGSPSPKENGPCPGSPMLADPFEPLSECSNFRILVPSSGRRRRRSVRAEQRVKPPLLVGVTEQGVVPADSVVTTVEALYDKFCRVYPAYKAPVKTFRRLCRKLSASADCSAGQSRTGLASHESGLGAVSECLFDAFVLQHVQYDRMCVRRIQSGKSVVHYEQFLSRNPLQPTGAVAVLTQEALRKAGL